MSDSDLRPNGAIPPQNTPCTPASGSILELQQHINHADLAFEEKIGHGSYGVVYKAKWIDRFVAVKEFEANAELKAIETEVKQLSRVNHPNIISLYGIAAHKRSKFLIMEYAEGGSLHDFLHCRAKPNYSTAHAMSWALQCAEGVAYLHAMTPKPLIHRDLKPLNLLLTQSGTRLKICDFGTVADKSTLMTNNKGSAAWMAPEVFEGSKYTEKCDIFSWSIVLWEMLSRQRPFKDMDTNCAIMWKIHQGARPPMIKDCPEPIKTLLTTCWLKSPDLRPAMKHVVTKMKELTALYPGADRPLEYEFRDQQIFRTDGVAESVNDYMLDFSPFNSMSYSGSSNQLTPTNDSHADSITPTNSTIDAADSTATGGAPPPLATIASTRWDVLPEEGPDAFRLTPSAATIERNATIRNGMSEMANVLMAPLAIDVNPHAWELEAAESPQYFAKSDGKERITVTDTKPLKPDMLPAGRHANANREMYPAHVEQNDDDYNENNNDDDDDDDDGEDSNESNDSEGIDGIAMLDPEYKPEPPIDHPESQQIYRDHRRLAKKYLLVDTQLSYAQICKTNLLKEMSPEQRDEKQELLKKMREKEELLGLFNNLKQQLEMSNSPAIQPANMQRSSQVYNTGSGANSQGELSADEGWVFVTPNQQT